MSPAPAGDPRPGTPAPQAGHPQPFWAAALLGSRQNRLAEPPPGRRTRIAAYAVLFVLGGLAALTGSFVQALWSPGGVLLALAGTIGLFYAGLRLTTTRLGAGMPLLAWFLVLLVLMSSRPEGDFVLASGLGSYAYLFAGAVGGVICATLPTRARYGPGAGLGPGRRS